MVTPGYDAELRRYNEKLQQAYAIQPHEHVLDIGCGSGQTTRQAAAHAETALGIDVSAAAIQHARELAQAKGLHNVTFKQADAQILPFPQESFDLAISRFGTMFFSDPPAAFTNIRQALRPGGRLVMMVWQSQEHNEWSLAIRKALDTPTTGGPDAFSLADPPTAKQLLDTAGFADITFTDVQEQVFYGPDVPAALGWIRGFACTSEALDHLDPAAATRATERLQEMLSAHETDDGVWFDSRAWIITATRP